MLEVASCSTFAAHYMLTPKTYYPEQVWCCLQDFRPNQNHVGICYRTPTVNIYGTCNHVLVRPLISRERLQVETVNLAWRRRAISSNEKNAK